MRRAFFYIAIILAIAGFSNALGQSRPTEQSWKKVDDKANMYLAFAKDILEMAQAHLNKKDIDEFNAAKDLSTSAQQAYDYFSAMSDLIWIYDQINSPSDKARVRPYINKRIDNCLQLLEHTIKSVNLELSYLTNAGIVATGTRLRDELRDGQSLLKAVKIR